MKINLTGQTKIFTLMVNLEIHDSEHVCHNRKGLLQSCSAHAARFTGWAKKFASFLYALIFILTDFQFLVPKSGENLQ